MHGLVLYMALDCFGLRPRNDDYVLANCEERSRKQSGKIECIKPCRVKYKT
jgi:hypothetical protein